MEELRLHPMIVHFPIGLFITALGFEAASLIARKESWHETARRIFAVAVISCGLAALTGLWEAWRIHLNHPVLNRHRFFALTTLAVSILGWFISEQLLKKKSNKAREVFLIFLCLIVVGIILTSFFGGEMVYEYGVGVAP